MREEADQALLAHRLPRAQLVDRIEFLVGASRGLRVIHVGFADARYRHLQKESESWLHEHLGEVASSLVGVDVDVAGVEEARSLGFEAYAADCCDREALAGLGLEPGDVVIAGELIEHVRCPGDLLGALHVLCRPGGTLIVTTPNASGWVNPMAALAGYEVNHPDHVVLFTWSTLTNLLQQEGWDPQRAATFVPRVKPGGPGGFRMALLALAARVALGIQRVVARSFAPFVADGLIVVARRQA